MKKDLICPYSLGNNIYNHINMQFEMKERVVAEVARLLQCQTLLFFYGKLLITIKSNTQKSELIHLCPSISSPME